MPTRPCFLVVDSEHANAISTRKLVLETAKYNVITAYSGEEAAELLQRFPCVEGVILNAVGRDGSLEPLWAVKKELPGVKLIVVGDAISTRLPLEPDTVVESFAPDKLLGRLRELFPDASRQLLAREAELEHEGV